MRFTARRVRRWLGGLLLALVALGGLHVGLLLFPAPLFAHHRSFGAYRIYSDAAIPDDFGRVIEETTWRLEAMEHGPPEARQRVYLCHSPRRYAFFAFLTRMSPESLAIGLSLANETFVSVSRVERFAAANRGRLRHTRFEGNLAEVIAHEIAHFNSSRALGFRAHLALPVWKSEGWAEYQANLAAIHADPGYSLARRIDQLLDDGIWGTGSSLARRLWEWQLLVEYLCEVEGYGLDRLARQELSESAARERMLAWHASN